MENLDLEAQLSRIFADVLVVFWQGHGPKGLNLDLPAHVHPGTVYNQDFRHTLDLLHQQGLCSGCCTISRPSRSIQTGSSGWCGSGGNSTCMGSAGCTSPPHSTMPIIPALRISLPCASCSSTASCRPGWMRLSWPQGLRKPVISTTASAPRCSRVPTGRRNRSTPRVVIFSPISPERTEKPLARSSSCSSAWIRCTCRRLGWLGSRATRERCFTVTPICASPSTPNPASSRMFGCPGFVRVWDALLCTASTIPSIAYSFSLMLAHHTHSTLL